MLKRALFGLLCLLFVSAHSAETVRVSSLDQALTPDGNPTSLIGVLYKPEGAGPFPAIVLLHGCGGLISPKTGEPDTRSVWWAEYFRQHGYVALMIDSFKSRGVTLMCPHAQPVIQADRERPLDAYGALRYLQKQPFVRADRVGVVGWSHGGGTVLFTVDAAASARPENLAHDFQAAVAFYPGWCKTRSHGWHWRTSIPLLVLLGESDNWVHAPPCEAFINDSRARGSPVDLVVYPDTFHDFDWPNSVRRTIPNFSGQGEDYITAPNPVAAEDAHARVIGFFDHYLKN
jgi:dienelactone hydrolase